MYAVNWLSQLQYMEEATPESSQPTTSKKAKGASSKEVGRPTWKKCTVIENNSLQGDDSLQCLTDKDPELLTLERIQLFHTMFPETYLDHLASMTCLYAAQKGQIVSYNKHDIAQFFGLLLISGYHNVPREDMYWSTAEDVTVSIVPTAMPRQKFRDIKKIYFHIMDNIKLKDGDKLGKISPLYDELNDNL
ncbi:hypothetical protein ANN_13134 [Periplaneta americana]|uniref:PiggyBac transposable element-derived protein domain-containing protein n=1 Tax=Periplaneta americana TaxID=6978 RepID=A0ABQ8TJJ3_PERAM|nr:hypothetical protein ANN_13134 [Periplaneta americana]